MSLLFYYRVQYLETLFVNLIISSFYCFANLIDRKIDFTFFNRKKYR